MVRTSFALVAVLLGAALVPATAFGQGANIFYPSKDFASECDIATWEPNSDPDFYNMVGTGKNFAVPMSGNWRGYVADFDRDALREWVGDAPAHVPESEVLVRLQGGASGALENGSFWLMAWQAGCDWVEGDGCVPIQTWNQGSTPLDGPWYGYKYNWSEGTASATKWSPNGAWKWDGGTKVADWDNCSGWVYPDGTPLMYRPEEWATVGMFAEHSKGFEELFFHNHITVNSTAVVPPAGTGLGPARFEVPVDEALVAELLGDIATTKCQGIMVKGFSAGFSLPDNLPTGGPCSGGSYNGFIFTREADGTPDPECPVGLETEPAEDWRPYLDIRIYGDANLDGYVDGADYTLWADNYEPDVTGKGWSQGDFNDDTITDGADYTLWADCYQKGTPPPGKSVPEPATVLLLCAGGCLAIRKRR